MTTNSNSQTQTQGKASAQKGALAEAALAAEVDAVELLTAQHREVDELFAQYEKLGEKAHKTKQKIATEICEKLTVHAKLEEKVFYPAAKEADDDLVLEAVEEHANVKAMIRKILAGDPSDESFDAKVKVLKELVKHHVKEEENEMFPKCKKALGEEKLDELGAKMQAMAERVDPKAGDSKKAKKEATKH